jgi:hypothetical protein
MFYTWVELTEDTTPYETYYANWDTKETSWEKPAGFDEHKVVIVVVIVVVV